MERTTTFAYAGFDYGSSSQPSVWASKQLTCCLLLLRPLLNMSRTKRPTNLRVAFTILFSHRAFQEPAISPGFSVVFRKEGSLQRMGKLPLEQTQQLAKNCEVIAGNPFVGHALFAETSKAEGALFSGYRFLVGVRGKPKGKPRFWGVTQKKRHTPCAAQIAQIPLRRVSCGDNCLRRVQIGAVPCAE